MLNADIQGKIHFLLWVPAHSQSVVKQRPAALASELHVVSKYTPLCCHINYNDYE